jgi:hypothetical protein
MQLAIAQRRYPSTHSAKAMPACGFSASFAAAADLLSAEESVGLVQDGQGYGYRRRGGKPTTNFRFRL